MTCVAGLVDNGVVWMAADAFVEYGAVHTKTDRKIFRKKNLLIGSAGTFRTSVALRFRFHPPQKPWRMDDYEYIATLFEEALFECVYEHSDAEYNEDGDPVYNSEFLVGYRGSLYIIRSDRSVGKVIEQFSAIGSGEIAARAAFAVRREDTDFCDPIEDLVYCLRFADKAVSNVQKSFRVWTDRKGLVYTYK